MNITTKSSTIGIVIIGSFNAEYYRPVNLYSKGIISSLDISNCREIEASQKLVIFTIPSFSIYVEQNRLQVICKDISESTKLVSLICNLLHYKIPETVNAVGVNVDFVFDISSTGTKREEDHFRLKQFFINQSSFTPLVENPVATQVNICEPTSIINDISIRKNICLKLPSDNVQFFQMSINNHLSITNNEINTVFSFVELTDKIVLETRDKFAQWTKKI